MTNWLMRLHGIKIEFCNKKCYIQSSVFDNIVMCLSVPPSFQTQPLRITGHALRITHYWSRVIDTMSEIVNQSIQKTFLQAKTFTKKSSRSSKRHRHHFHRHHYWNVFRFHRQNYPRPIYNTNRIRYLLLSTCYNKHFCYNFHSRTTRRFNKIHRLF